MTNFIQILFLLSMKTSLFIGVILLIKRVFRNILTANVQYYLWFFVFLSLTIPYAPMSNMSIYNLFSKVPSIEQTMIPSNSSLELNTGITSETAKAPFSAPITELTPNREKTELPTSALLDFWQTKNLVTLFSYLWFLGFCILGISFLVQTIVCYRKIQKETPIVSPEIIALLEDCKQRLQIKQDIKLVKTHDCTTPSFIGFFHPTILIPQQILDDFEKEELSLIFLHELAHYKRNDLWITSLIFIYQAIYWFHPILWIGWYTMKNDMEIACDAYVLKHLDPKKHTTYGQVIIALLEYFSSYPRIPISTNILKNKSQIKRRIVMIKNFNHTSRTIAITSFVLLSLVGYSFLTTPHVKAEPLQPSNDSSQAISFENLESVMSATKAESILQQKNDLLFRNDVNLFDLAGTPYAKTYYVSTKNLTSAEIVENMYSESMYPVQKSTTSEALYVFQKDDKILGLTKEEFTGNLHHSWKNTDYTVTVCTEPENSCIDAKDIPEIVENFKIPKLKEEFLQQSFSEFKECYHLGQSATEASNQAGTLHVSIYPVISSESPSPVCGLTIVTKNDTIIKMYVDRPDIEFEKIEEYFH